MVKWLNHVTIAAPRNGTTDHTVDPSSGTAVAGSLFTPTAGRFLIVFVEGAVTSTTPSGWTLPSGGSAINNTGLYMWYRTAAGSDVLTTTHNGANYPVVFDVYEFPAGTTFISAAAAGNVSASGGAGPSLTGLTASASWRAAIVGQDRSNTISPVTVSWSVGTEAVDTFEILNGTDGYCYSLAYVEDATSDTFSSAATVTDAATSCERLVVALNIPSAGTQHPATVTVSASSGAALAAHIRRRATTTIAATSGMSATNAANHAASVIVPVSSTSSFNASAKYSAVVEAVSTSAMSVTAHVRRAASIVVSAVSSVIVNPTNRIDTIRILAVEEVERDVRVVEVDRDILIDEVTRNVKVKEVR